MISFETALKALVDGKHIRRSKWGEGSLMYADANGTLNRTPNKGARVQTGDYSWALELNDLTAKDWQMVEPTSRLR